MHPAPTTPLGQAFAAIIALLIAAIAEHAREHPLLAPGCRASIRQLEKLARKFEAMAAEWQATQSQQPNRKAGFSPPPHPRTRPATARPRRAAAPVPRRRIALWHPARGPPHARSPANRPPGAARAHPIHTQRRPITARKLSRNPSGRETPARTPTAPPPATTAKPSR